MSETKISSSEQEQEKQMFEQWKLQIEQEVKILQKDYPQANIQAKISNKFSLCMINFTYSKEGVDNTTGGAGLSYENDTKKFVLFLNYDDGQSTENFGEAKNIVINDLRKKLDSIFGKK